MKSPEVMARIGEVLHRQGFTSAHIHLKSHLGAFAPLVNAVLGEQILSSVQLVACCSKDHQAGVMQVMAMAGCQLDFKSEIEDQVWLAYDFLSE
jgi:hypothetical protein